MSETICFVSLISKENSPLYIQLFTFDPIDQVDDPQHEISSSEANKLLKYNFLSHMSLDIFESRFFESLSQDNSNLLFVQDGISVYGFETNTGLKVVIGTNSKQNISEKLYTIFRSIHKMYLKIICNPFYQHQDSNAPLNNDRFDTEVKKLIDDFNS